MDKLMQYREWIKQVLTYHGQFRPSYGEVKNEIFFDLERDHYQLFGKRKIILLQKNSLLILKVISVKSL